MAAITLKLINEVLAPLGWKCLSTEYKNLDTPLVFQCHEGHKVHDTWKKVRTKATCPICNENPVKKLSEIKAAPKKKGEYRVLALDQSSHKTGWSVYDKDVLRGYGVYQSTCHSALDRMVDIVEWLICMIDSWKPDMVGLEETQYNASAGVGHDVFKLLSQVMGALMVSAAREKVKVETVLIPTWRHHCGVRGNKRTDQKRSAQLLVKKWYDISVTDDESDAICIGKYFSDNHLSKQQIVIGEWSE